MIKVHNVTHPACIHPPFAFQFTCGGRNVLIKRCWGLACVCMSRIRLTGVKKAAQTEKKEVSPLSPESWLTGTHTIERIYIYIHSVYSLAAAVAFPFFLTYTVFFMGGAWGICNMYNKRRQEQRTTLCYLHISTVFVLCISFLCNFIFNSDI